MDPSAGFRYLLHRANGQPADPAIFHTAFDGWKLGDTFLAGRDLRRYRILVIDDEAAEVRSWHVHALWVVEPVANSSRAPRPQSHDWELISIASDGSRETHDYRSESWLNPGDRFAIEHFGKKVIVEVERIERSHIEGRAKVTTHVIEN